MGVVHANGISIEHETFGLLNDFMLLFVLGFIS